MPSPVEELLIDWITGEWRRIRQEDRPWGLWFRRHLPLPQTATEIDCAAVPEAVWFIDDGGLRPESVWKWLRFVAMRPFDASDGGRPLSAIGQAAFAPYLGSREYYVETVWGPRCGEGARWDPDAGDPATGRRELWRS
jgi:hypothetical protein